MPEAANEDGSRYFRAIRRFVQTRAFHVPLKPASLGKQP
jgi:hypothetical protein